jgi:uncharacterized protein (DUF697 family)
MITVAPSPHPFSHPVSTAFNSYAKPLKSAYPIASTDIFENTQRAKLLQVLKNPTVFEAVLDESQKPSPEVKQLRALLAKQKISSQELFSSPELMVNFYEHLAQQEQEKSKTAKTKAAQDNFKIQALMMKTQADYLRRKYNLLPTPISALPQTQHSKTPKFGGWFVGLFNEVTQLFTERGNPGRKSEAERREDANRIINRGSFLAGGLAGGLSKIMFADDVALTAVTVGTITKIAYGVYGIEGISESTLAVIVGKVAGARVADGIVDYAIEKGLGMIPILGEIASASTAYGLHQATGRLFLEYFEHQMDQRRRQPNLRLGMPASFAALTSVMGLADATQAVDLEGATQVAHYNTLNDARVVSGDYQSAPSSYMENRDGSILEVHNIIDDQGNLYGHPDRNWLLNDLAHKTENVQDAVALFKVLGNIPTYISYPAIEKLKRGQLLSAETIKSIVDKSSQVVSWKLLILGDDSIRNPGFRQWLEDAIIKGKMNA